MKKIVSRCVKAILILANAVCLIRIYSMSKQNVLGNYDEDEFTGNLCSTAQLHLVTNYPIMAFPPWLINQTEKNMTRLMERQKEIEETLQRNLNHPHVKALHIFLNQNNAEERVNSLDLRNKHKLVVRYYSGTLTYKHFFSYVNQRLTNELIAVTNMDIYLGEGFEKINISLMTKHNIAYALTRSGKKERRCYMNSSMGRCEEKRYIGSHDTYIMKLKEPVSNEVLEELENGLHRAGTDNKMVWVLKKKMNMTVLNPCLILRTYHNHCSGVHAYQRYDRIPGDKVFLCPPSGLYK